jgi:uncharacterized protein with PQ loop repeat
MSAVAKELNHVIIYTTLYHILLDIIIIVQTIYYRIYHILFNQHIESASELTPFISSNNFTVTYDNYKYFYMTLYEFIYITSGFILITIFQLLLMFLDDNHNILLANIIAWVSTSIFIIARCPQILLNLKRKSTQGLSVLSFIIINIANFLFLTSILVLLIDIPNENHTSYIIKNIQWISGSLSTVFFDVIIFYQFYIYRNNSSNV